MNRIRVGLTSPLIGEEVPMEGMEVTHHQRALERAGAEPIILWNDMDPFRVIEELGLRGIVFSGGGDICAARYGGNEALANDRLNPQRDVFEFSLMRESFERGIPVLAICRGMQVANVLLGGTLIEDIHHNFATGTLFPHNQVKDAGLSPMVYTHEIVIESGTKLRALAGAERVKTNSVHHQAVREIASALLVSASAEDGVIEAIEFAPGYLGPKGRRGFFIGIQWHPEVLTDDQLSQSLYVQFVEACKAP